MHQEGRFSLVKDGAPSFSCFIYSFLNKFSNLKTKIQAPLGGGRRGGFFCVTCLKPFFWWSVDRFETSSELSTWILCHPHVVLLYINY
jgi:hypothetical protein